MIWGYPYFRKPPHITCSFQLLEVIDFEALPEPFQPVALWPSQWRLGCSVGGDESAASVEGHAVAWQTTSQLHCCWTSNIRQPPEHPAGSAGIAGMIKRLLFQFGRPLRSLRVNKWWQRSGVRLEWSTPQCLLGQVLHFSFFFFGSDWFRSSQKIPKPQGSLG